MQQLDDVAKRLEALDEYLAQTTLDPTLGKLLGELFLQRQVTTNARAEIAACLPMLGVAQQIAAGLDATRAVKPTPSDVTDAVADEISARRKGA